MSSDAASIRVDGLGKRYEVYESPRQHLKQLVIPPLQRLAGLQPWTYYHEFWALRDISFEIARGEAFGVVGRNGSGKSTLLQLITGTLAPTTGTVQTRGRIAALLELGSGFNPDFTGRENVFLNARLLGLTQEETEARFDRIASFADIGAHLDQPVKTYSSGMLVRLAFAVQVQIEPDILIVDEALAVGDALFQKRCFARIEKLRADGVTLLFVSHDQESVRTLTNRAILLKQGRAVDLGPSSQVLLAYRRLLHQEESEYFSKLGPPPREVDVAAAEASPTSAQPTAAAPATLDAVVAQRSSALSFGDGGMEVVRVQTFDASGEPCAVFYPGDRLRIRVECVSAIESDRISVAVRVRNREGIKMYSWGTLNQDMQILAGLIEGDVFWHRRIGAGEQFEVWFECECMLGSNFYEIQAAISYEGSPDYLAQRILHWKDEAAFFQALVPQEGYFFGGLTDMRMAARW